MKLQLLKMMSLFYTESRWAQGTRRMKRNDTRISKGGAFIGANAQILGSLEVGEFSKIGAGAVVLEDVAPKKTVVGTPAKAVHQSQSKVFSIAPDKQVKKLENS